MAATPTRNSGNNGKYTTLSANPDNSYLLLERQKGAPRAKGVTKKEFKTAVAKVLGEYQMESIQQVIASLRERIFKVSDFNVIWGYLMRTVIRVNEFFVPAQCKEEREISKALRIPFRYCNHRAAEVTDRQRLIKTLQTVHRGREGTRTDIYFNLSGINARETSALHDAIAVQFAALKERRPEKLLGIHVYPKRVYEEGPSTPYAASLRKVVSDIASGELPLDACKNNIVIINIKNAAHANCVMLFINTEGEKLSVPFALFFGVCPGDGIEKRSAEINMVTLNSNLRAHRNEIDTSIRTEVIRIPLNMQKRAEESENRIMRNAFYVDRGCVVYGYNILTGLVTLLLNKQELKQKLTNQIDPGQFDKDRQQELRSTLQNYLPQYFDKTEKIVNGEKKVTYRHIPYKQRTLQNVKQRWLISILHIRQMREMALRGEILPIFINTLTTQIEKDIRRCEMRIAGASEKEAGRVLGRSPLNDAIFEDFMHRGPFGSFDIPRTRPKPRAQKTGPTQNYDIPKKKPLRADPNNTWLLLKRTASQEDPTPALFEEACETLQGRYAALTLREIAAAHPNDVLLDDTLFGYLTRRSVRVNQLSIPMQSLEERQVTAGLQVPLRHYKPGDLSEAFPKQRNDLLSLFPNSEKRNDLSFNQIELAPKDTKVLQDELFAQFSQSKAKHPEKLKGIQMCPHLVCETLPPGGKVEGAMTPTEFLTMIANGEMPLDNDCKTNVILFNHGSQYELKMDHMKTIALSVEQGADSKPIVTHVAFVDADESSVFNSSDSQSTVTMLQRLGIINFPPSLNVTDLSLGIQTRAKKNENIKDGIKFHMDLNCTLYAYNTLAGLIRLFYSNQELRAAATEGAFAEKAFRAELESSLKSSLTLYFKEKNGELKPVSYQTRMRINTRQRWILTTLILNNMRQAAFERDEAIREQHEEALDSEEILHEAITRVITTLPPLNLIHTSPLINTHSQPGASCG